MQHFETNLPLYERCSPTLLLGSNPLVDSIFVLLDDAHSFCIKALSLFIVMSEELMKSCTNNVLLLQLLAESNVIQCVTI